MFEKTIRQITEGGVTSVFSILLISLLVIVVLLLINRVPLVYTFRNLTLRWKTTLMSGMAFTLIIALLMVMLAFTTGMQRLTEGTGQPGNVLVLAEGSTDESFSNLNKGELTEIENLPQIERDPQTGRPLSSRETYLIVNQPVSQPKPGMPQRRFLQLRGIEDPSLAYKVHSIELLPGGSWFSAAGVQELPDEPDRPPAVQAVLGEGVARELGADRPAEELAKAKNRERLDVGDRFQLGLRTWIVVGVMKSAGSTFGSEVWAKQALVGPVFGKDTITTTLLRLKDAQAAADFATFLKSGYKKASFNAQTETSYYESLSDTNKQFLVVIVFITIVMGCGGVFGIMNTMFAAISHRSRDIGVLRLLGYARWHILVSFLMESLLIAVVGGLFGCLLGSCTNGWTATSVLSNGGAGGKLVVLQLTIDARVWACGILLAILTGGVGGIIPALYAMGMKPLKALR